MLTPSSQSLLNYVNKQIGQHDATSRETLKSTAYEMASQERRAEQIVQRDVAAFLSGKAYGTVPKTKPPHVLRWYFENMNSLCVFTHGRKIKTLNDINTAYQVDGVAGCELQADWRFASEEQQWKNLFGRGQETRSQVGYNTNERLLRNQKGGTGMTTIGRLSASVMRAPAFSSCAFFAWSDPRG